MSGDGSTPREPHSVSAPIAEFRMRSLDGVVVFEIEGELDLSNADDLAEALAEAVAEDSDSMLVDLASASSTAPASARSSRRGGA